MVLLRLVVLGLCASASLGVGQRTAGASGPDFYPERPRLGDLVFVSLSADVPSTGTGTITAFQYHFGLVSAGSGAWRGVLAVPVDVTAGPFPVVVEIGGRRWSSALDVEGRSFRRSELSVAKKFTKKRQPRAIRERVKRESEAWQQMLERPPGAVVHFESPVRPAAGARTSEFGVERVLNGVVESQHYGLDLDGAVGDPAWALQSGTVALASERFYSGGTIVLDHGHGLYSAYFHLSKLGLRPGAAVRAGAVLGAVGRTGRVTGPHLHLSILVRARSVADRKIRGLYVDPEPWLERRWGSDGEP